MQKNQFLKVKDSLLELQKFFIKLKDVELKDRKVKIKREIEELLFKPISVLPITDEMDELFLNQLLCLQMKWISLNKKKWKK